jgi:alpha-beta hydrolase superfamily lysophospholipase
MKLPNKDFSRDPQVVAAMDKDPYILQKSGPVRTAAQLLKAMDEISSRMEKFTVPVLILHGDADKLANPNGSRKLSDRAASSDKTLKIYPGLVHDLVHEPEKAQVIADIVAWLDAKAPRNRPPVPG